MSSTLQLHVIEEQVRIRVKDIASGHGAWPCRKGCDDCCRRLASLPIVTKEEWRRIAAHLDRLDPRIAESIRERIRNSRGASRPVVCPMLDLQTGACLVYEARPIACRTYRFYVERENVLGCDRIELIADESRDVIWGNAAAVEHQLQRLGPAAELHRWLDA